VFELVALAFVVVVALTVIGLVVGLIWWLFVLPFQILGFLFKLVGLLLVLPFLLLAGFAGALIFGTSVLVSALPLLPLVLLGLGVWWLARRGRRTATAR
jgi:hypothetical protein